MRKLVSLLLRFKRAVVTLLTICVCIAEYYLIPSDSDFTLFITLLSTAILSLSVYLVLIKKRAILTPFIICSIMAIIFANKLYSNKEIIALFPLLENVPPALLSFFFVILLFVLYYAFLFVKELFAEMSEPSISNEQAIPTSHPTTEDGVHVTATPATEIQTTAQPIRKHTNILRTLLMALASVAIIALTFISYEWLKVGSEEIITTDIAEFASTILTNGAIILIVFLAVMFSIYALVEMIRFLFSHVWPVESSAQIKSKVTFPWVVSFFGVLILFYIGFSFTGFTLDDFTELTSEARYIALPLAIIVIFITFWILVRISHSLLLLIIELNPKDLKESLSKRISKFMQTYINDIGNTLINDIILKTIKTALDYVAFIPSFFSTFYKFTFLTDEYDQVTYECDESEPEENAEATCVEN